MHFKRNYQNLEQFLEKNKVLLIFGPRRVGKTTLIKDFLSKTKLKYKLDSGENIATQSILSSQNFDQIKKYCAGYELIVIDEAQKIPNVGLGLKIIVDNIPNIYIIATGSSSFELIGQTGEPLVGRKRNIKMYPISITELQKIYAPSEIPLETLLVYGTYPSVLNASVDNEKSALLRELVDSYLLKDILEFERIKGSKTLLDLLRLISYQVGNQVSLSELGMNLSIDYKTVARYLDLLEKSFILFNLRGYSRNLRKEITSKSKYFFYDLGIRNAIISNFNEIDKRNDVGQLWENFLVIERLKCIDYKPIFANLYFWRTWEQKEIDWVEEREGKLFGYEFKYNSTSSKSAKHFLETYPGSTVTVVNKDNYLDFVGSVK
ncbi:ATP-binding protein [Candidatus Dojkabacteria bacterium]|nr:ATP-binding protein [Candidatus Dojkabacteria bacterium]